MLEILKSILTERYGRKEAEDILKELALNLSLIETRKVLQGYQQKEKAAEQARIHEISKEGNKID